MVNFEGKEKREAFWKIVSAKKRKEAIKAAKKKIQVRLSFFHFIAEAHTNAQLGS